MNDLELETRNVRTERSPAVPESGGGPGPALMGATTLVGDDVCNETGESLGRLREIMLDTRSGRIAYAVLESGGFLGIGAKLFAVPWKALRLDAANKRMVLDAETAFLERAPGFDADRWPDMADPTWTNQIHSYFGTAPYRRRPL